MSDKEIETLKNEIINLRVKLSDFVTEASKIISLTHDELGSFEMNEVTMKQITLWSDYISHGPKNG